MTACPPVLKLAGILYDWTPYRAFRAKVAQGEFALRLIRSFILLFSLFPFLGLTAHAQSYYVFGDSLSDNGNLYIALGGSYPPSDTYSWGRASNGSTWTERMGFHLGNVPNAKELREPYGGFANEYIGYNFAHYGATVTPGLAPYRGQSLSVQIGSFRNKVWDNQLVVDPNDRFTIWIGANDFLAYGITDYKSVAYQLRTQVSILDKLGAKNILVMDQPYWGDTPYGLSRGDSDSLNTLLLKYNRALKGHIQRLHDRNGIDVYFVSMQALFDDVLSNPAAYGFEIAGPGEGTSGNCLGDGLVLSACPSTYVFYDSLHPTSAMHGTMASYVNAQYLAIQAERAYSGIAVSAASPALALQTRALSDDVSLAAGQGWSLIGTEELQLITFSAAPTDEISPLETAFDAVQRENQFSLVGVKSKLPGEMTIGFVLSSGTPESRLTGAHPVTASSGWAVRLERPLGAFDLTISANGIEQSFERQRATGFERDPVVRASWEQDQSLTLIGLDRAIDLGDFQIQTGASLGFAQQRRSGVTETARTNLVTMNSGSEHRLDEASEIHFSLLHAGYGTRHAWRAGSEVSSARVNGDGYSAWSLLGEDQFTSTDYVGARNVSRLSFFGEYQTRAGLNGSARLTLGQSELEDLQAVQFSLGYRW